MTIKSYTAGSLSLNEIQAEFGGPSSPINLLDYRAGGSYVNSGVIGYPNGVATAIPSSAPISINNFYGASAEPNAVTLANYFWNNRASLVRYSTRGAGLSYFPGNNFNQNDFSARYVGSFTNNWYYSNSGLPITSSFFTAVSVSAGGIGNYGGITSVSTGGGSLITNPATITLVGDAANPTNVGNGYGLSVKLQVFQGQINSVTSHSITSAHMGGNNGAWSYVYLIPGKWGFSSSWVNFDGSLSPTLAGGEMLMTIVERGGDYNNPIPQPDGISNVMTVDQWWYNAAGIQMSVNTSSSPTSVSWPSLPYYDGDGNIVGYSSYFSGMTPRITGVLTRYY